MDGKGSTCGKRMTATQQNSTKQDILHLLLKQGQATAQELSEHLQITPQAIRRHLKDLETEGLIIHQVIHEGMGRPNYVYALSREGRNQFPHRHEEFAVSLLDTLTETVGADQVGSILRKQWERKAIEYRERLGNASLEERVKHLVEIRREEGYMAEYYPVGASQTDVTEVQAVDGTSFILTEYNCAISQIAESYPSVCGHELEMFEIALDCQVERTHWLVDGEHRCGYLIRQTH
jgi:DeoR family suf operon transcriptional repressor